MKIFVRLHLICIFILFNTNLRSSCLLPSGTDITDKFDNLYHFKIDHQSDDFRKNVEKLREYTILLIPGIDFDLMEELYNGGRFQYLRRKIFQLFELRGHLQDYKDFFDENNIKYKTLTVNDDRNFSQTDKVTRIINLIKSTQGNIIFVAHSKGGVDIQTILLHFLNSNLAKDKYEFAKIKGAIFLQVPFQGSPLADLYLKGQSFFSRPIKFLFRTWFRRNSEHVESLSLIYRRSFNEKNKINLYDLNQKMNFLSYSTYVPRESDNFRYPFFAYSRNAIFDHYQLDNDGLVPCGSAWPGSNFIIGKDIGHARTIRKSTFWGRAKDLDRKKLFFALIKIWFAHNQK